MNKYIYLLCVSILLVSCSNPKEKFIKEATETCEIVNDYQKDSKNICECIAEYYVNHIFKKNDFALIYKYENRMPQSDTEMKEKYYIKYKVNWFYSLYFKNPNEYPLKVQQEIKEYVKNCNAKDKK